MTTFKSALLGGLGALALVATAPAALAADFFPGDPNFQTTGDITSGPVTAYIGNSGIAAGNFTDRFIFHIDQDGFGSGSVSTSTTKIGSPTDVDFTSVRIIAGGTVYDALITYSDGGLTEFASVTGVPIAFGAENIIEINGYSHGNGSYGGQATFLPIPEPATWAMMIAGFGLVGAGMRRQRRATKVTLA